MNRLKNLLFLLAFIFHFVPSIAQQRVIAECTIEFGISADSLSIEDAAYIASLRQSKKVVYIKGMQSRVDFINPGFTQTVIHRKDAGATILRQFGNNRFMMNLSHDQWIEENDKYRDVQFISLDETKSILNYTCKKARLILREGEEFEVYYVPNMIPSVRDYEYQFSVVPGLVLAYESTDQQKRRVKFLAARINFSPVQSTRFDIPSSGYRILEWVPNKN